MERYCPNYSGLALEARYRVTTEGKGAIATKPWYTIATNPKTAKKAVIG